MKIKFNPNKERVCITCGNIFLPNKPLNNCSKCINEKARLNRIKYKEEGKIPQDKTPYPFCTKTNQAGARFNKIKRELNKAWNEGREAVKRHYDKQLKEAEELGILEWIYDRRDTSPKIKNGQIGRPVDKRTQYPSTKDMPY
jgi:hypothetical protein